MDIHIVGCIDIFHSESEDCFFGEAGWIPIQERPLVKVKKNIATY